MTPRAAVGRDKAPHPGAPSLPIPCSPSALHGGSGAGQATTGLMPARAVRAPVRALTRGAAGAGPRAPSPGTQPEKDPNHGHERVFWPFDGGHTSCLWGARPTVSLEDGVVVVIATDLAPKLLSRGAGPSLRASGTPGHPPVPPVSHSGNQSVSGTKHHPDTGEQHGIHILISSLRSPCFSKAQRD